MHKDLYNTGILHHKKEHKILQVRKNNYGDDYTKADDQDRSAQ